MGFMQNKKSASETEKSTNSHTAQRTTCAKERKYSKIRRHAHEVIQTESNKKLKKRGQRGTSV